MTLQILRTALWILMAVLISSFVAINWQKTSINLWPLENGYLHVDWPVGLIALAAIAVGMVPIWLVAKARIWRLKRRIAGLENTLRAATPTPPIATATQLDAAAQEN
ncbi:LapA family protein [Novosphingobium sp. KACC 22771]|uniref:LapA family protein n=1 Tax=Novosphingobium sp. KACC 22771 TaxID=3025670 RepID=UPI00236617E1|nr:LapA family protein [Novosphingobium sp. KACC 22771]WDF73854.1 LapA family protein [Novosphingobium sp. KACC 22771]